MKRFFILILTLVFAIATQAQEDETLYDLPGIIVDGDTLALIHLQKVYIFPKLKFASDEDYKRYRKLVRDVKKVYPYAQLAKRTFHDVQATMDTLPKRQQKKYINEKEDELVAMYLDELKSMTVRQGEILVKLVNREMDKTPYQIIKMLKGGFAATMWQGVAKVFGENLKDTYDVESRTEDFLIERIVIQIEQGII